MDWWNKIKKHLGTTEFPRWVLFLLVFLFVVWILVIIHYGLTSHASLFTIIAFTIFAIRTFLKDYFQGIRSFAANKQAETDSKRQSADTFAKSVDLLASNQDGEPAIESRIGGIYALEKLASADAKNYAGHVMKMLVTYIQENAQKTARPVASKKSDEKTTDPDKRKEPAPLGKDVKTAFAALKRLHDNNSVFDKSGLKREPQDELSFSDTDFRALRMGEIKWINKPDLRNAKLQGANLARAQLQGANLHVAQLQGANLEETQLQGADLFGAQLQVADLHAVKLQGANLLGARLLGADLHWAQLQGADLSSAQLPGADLTGARLQGANFLGARLSGVILTKAKAYYTSFVEVYFDLSQGTCSGELEDLAERGYVTKDKAESIHERIRGDVNIAIEKDTWRIWYSDRSVFAKYSIKSPSEGIEWDLGPILKDMFKDSQKPFLQGLLRNFAEMEKKEPTGRAQQCRLAVRKLQDSHPDLWEALDSAWTKWLEALDEDG